MSKDENNTQTVKRVSSESETRFTFPSQDELADDRVNARNTMRRSTQFRWAMFITALQRFRRSAEQRVRDGEAASPVEAFWYQSDTTITAYMYLVFFTLSGQTRRRSDLERDLAVSKPFLRKFTNDGIAAGHFDADYTLNEASIDLYIDRVNVIFDMPEIRDFADSMHVMTVAESKASRIT
jgi:hypothetical protein